MAASEEENTKTKVGNMSLSFSLGDSAKGSMGDGWNRRLSPSR